MLWKFRGRKKDFYLHHKAGREDGLIFHLQWLEIRIEKWALEVGTTCGNKNRKSRDI